MMDASKHAGAILKLLVSKLRQRWANTRLIIRADSGFCRNRILSWCDRHDIGYIIGLARNERLQRMGESLQQRAAEDYEQTGKTQRLFGGFEYAAKSWTWLRWVIHKAEHTDKGSNPRFVVTNLEGDQQQLYDDIYCARGDMENRIKEQMMLFSDRTSTHRWWANQYRLLLSGLAYTLDRENVVSDEVILKDIGRIRDVASGPDGAIYVVLNGPDELIRLVPSE